MKVFVNPSCFLAEELNGLKESTVTLNIGQNVVNRLTTAGLETELQQLDDVDAIVKACNDWGADVFVAIHCNAATATASGTETFYCQGSVNGEKLAKAIQPRIVSTVGTVDRGVKDDTQSGAGRLSVLRNTICPAVLVETAFLSNVGDAQLLRDRQADFAKAIAEGILEYCGVDAGAVSEAAAVVDEPVPVLNVDFKVVGAKVRKYDSKDDLLAVKNDSGAMIYGMYKFSSANKTVNEFVDWLSKYHDVKLANYGNALAKDPIDSEAFIETWNNLAKVDPGNFTKLQDEFVKVNYFDKAVAALVKEHYHLDRHSTAMQTEVFTRAYQNGVDACVDALKQACGKLGHPNLSYVDDKNFDSKLIGSIDK